MHLSVFLSQQKKTTENPAQIRPDVGGNLTHHTLPTTGSAWGRRTSWSSSAPRYRSGWNGSSFNGRFQIRAGISTGKVCEIPWYVNIYIYSCIYVGNRGFICCIRYASTDWVKVFSFFFHTMFPKCVEILKMWHLRCKHGLLLSCLRIRQLPHTVADEHIWGLMGSNG